MRALSSSASLYESSSEDRTVIIFVSPAEISVVVVDTDEKCNQLLDRSPKCLRRIIVIRGTRPSTNQKARNRGVELLSFEEVEKAGASKTFPEQVINAILTEARSIINAHLSFKTSHLNRPICARYATLRAPRGCPKG